MISTVFYRGSAQITFLLLLTLLSAVQDAAGLAVHHSHRRFRSHNPPRRQSRFAPKSFILSDLVEEHRQTNLQDLHFRHPNIPGLDSTPGVVTQTANRFIPCLRSKREVTKGQVGISLARPNVTSNVATAPNATFAGGSTKGRVGIVLSEPNLTTSHPLPPTATITVPADQVLVIIPTETVTVMVDPPNVTQMGAESVSTQLSCGGDGSEGPSFNPSTTDTPKSCSVQPVPSVTSTPKSTATACVSCHNATSSTRSQSTSSPTSTPAPMNGCFPGLYQKGVSQPSIPSMPATEEGLNSWWCNQWDEYGFMGFSYDLTACPSRSDLTADFKRMRTKFSARYVRLYGACDRDFGKGGIFGDIVEAAATAGIGIYGLVWFGFDGDDRWKTRMSDLISTIKTNPKAPYIIRNIAVGSEPLFDQVLSPKDLAAQVQSVKSQLAQYGMQVTVSDMPYGFQSNGDAPEVFKAIDILEINALPFFDSDANTGGNAWGTVSWDISYFQQHGPGKLTRLTQTGWPSDQSVWPANSKNAVASLSSEKAYFDLLDSKCSTFKSMSVGWFAQIWSDDMLGGWGILDSNGKTKFMFRPRMTC